MRALAKTIGEKARLRHGAADRGRHVGSYERCDCWRSEPRDVYREVQAVTENMAYGFRRNHRLVKWPVLALDIVITVHLRRAHHPLAYWPMRPRFAMMLGVALA